MNYNNNEIIIKVNKISFPEALVRRKEYESTLVVNMFAKLNLVNY